MSANEINFHTLASATRLSPKEDIFRVCPTPPPRVLISTITGLVPDLIIIIKSFHTLQKNVFTRIKT